MTEDIQLRVYPDVAYDEAKLIDYIVQEKGLDRSRLRIRVTRRSIDARQRRVMVNLGVRLFVDEMPDDAFRPTDYRPVDGKRQAIVVGAGPAGLFAALRLIEHGIRPVILERGKTVRERKRDIALITRTQEVDPESNYSFGEGGAGAFSDGKLYTRSKKRGNVDKVLNVLCQHGADTAILVDAHPHIGTDKLPRVIENIRATITGCGGEFHFQTRMTALIVKDGRAIAVETADGRTFMGDVILATGHSARDVYRWLNDNGIGIEAKALAVGVRLEHPQHLIDCLQYHSSQGRGRYLPPAEYSMVAQVDGRGVYSFCMCPGGFVVPAASGPEQVVVNGMSPSNRGSRWANSGMVVEVRPTDVGATSDDDALCMMRFQEQLERDAWQQGGMRQTAPAQRMADFVNGKLGDSLPESSYTPGLVASPLHFWLPAFVSNRLRKGFVLFSKSAKGFLTNHATVIGVETRTSSPVRIVRDPETLQHVEVAGLYPCGEGAGYAGGIVSAAIDGERCADALAQTVKQ